MRSIVRLRKIGEVTEDLSVRRCGRDEGWLSEEEVRRRVKLGSRVFGSSEAVLRMMPLMSWLGTSKSRHRRNASRRVVRAKSWSSTSIERRPFGDSRERNVRGRSGSRRRTHHVLLLCLLLVVVSLLLLLFSFVIEYWHTSSTLSFCSGGGSSSGFTSRVGESSSSRGVVPPFVRKVGGRSISWDREESLERLRLRLRSVLMMTWTSSSEELLR